MARTARQIDLAQLEKLASLQCTIEEAAAWFGYTKRGFLKRLERKDERAVWERGKEKGRISLRRAQFLTASQENPDPRSRATMQIWLGKQWLAQKDKQEVTGPDNGPVQLEVSAREQLLGKLARLAAAGSASGGDKQPQ